MIMMMRIVIAHIYITFAAHINSMWFMQNCRIVIMMNIVEAYIKRL